MATRTVSKTVNPGSNPGSPARPRGLAWRASASGLLVEVRLSLGFDAVTSTRLSVTRSPLAAIGLLAAALIGALALIGPTVMRTTPAAAGTTAGCKNVDLPILEGTGPQARKATLCLINEERRRHARRALSPNKALGKAAAKHAKTMVKKNCLSHRCPGEPGLETRIRRTGYFSGARSFRFSENTGCAVTAESMVANWMGSRFHRINLLGKDFDEVGISTTKKRVPRRCSRGYGTFAVVFGVRK